MISLGKIFLKCVGQIGICLNPDSAVLRINEVFSHGHRKTVNRNRSVTDRTRSLLALCCKITCALCRRSSLSHSFAFPLSHSFANSFAFSFANSFAFSFANSFAFSFAFSFAKCLSFVFPRAWPSFTLSPGPATNNKRVYIRLIGDLCIRRAQPKSFRSQYIPARLEPCFVLH